MMRLYQCDGWVRFTPKDGNDAEAPVSMMIRPMTYAEARRHHVLGAMAMEINAKAETYEQMARDVFVEHVRDVSGLELDTVADDGTTTVRQVTTGADLYDVIPDDMRTLIYKAVTDGGALARDLAKKSISPAV
jgi:hypothetical protein